MTSHVTDQLWDAQFLRRAIDAAEVALWSWNVETDLFNMDRLAFAMWGISNNSTVTFEDLSAKYIHPTATGCAPLSRPPAPILAPMKSTSVF